MMEIQHKLLANAYRDKLLEAKDHLTKSSDAPVTEFSVGQYVLHYPPAGRQNKTAMTWLGPMRVVARDGDSYILQSLIDESRLKRHVSTIKPFVYPDSGDPAKIAARDRQEYLVDSIVEHEPKIPTRSTGKFLVHWAGYDSSYDTWEPYDNLRDNEHFHEYCFDHNLFHLIPRAKQQEVLDRREPDTNARIPRVTPPYALRL
jgi:hypothetical protein